MMRAVLLAAVFLAAGVPLLPRAAPSAPPQASWPAALDGRPLRPIAAGPGDALLAQGFPGHVARFSDGRRQIVLRQVSRATRMLHPPRDCFAALDYAIEPLPMARVTGGHASCFAAQRGGTRLKVCEHIRDRRGIVYPDVPSWYWPALTGTSRGPWLAVMTVEQRG